MRDPAQSGCYAYSDSEPAHRVELLEDCVRLRACMNIPTPEAIATWPREDACVVSPSFPSASPPPPALPARHTSSRQSTFADTARTSPPEPFGPINLFWTPSAIFTTWQPLYEVPCAALLCPGCDCAHRPPRRATADVNFAAWIAQVVARPALVPIRQAVRGFVSTKSASAEVNAYTIEEKGDVTTTDYRVFFHNAGALKW